MFVTPKKLDRETDAVGCFNTSNNLPRLESGSRSGTGQSVSCRQERGARGGEEGVQARSPLSAQVLLCRVSHIFPLLAVALVVWLVALVTFGGGGGALLPVVAALLVRTRHPGLSSLVASRWSAVSVALCSVVIDNSRLFSVGAGAPARLLLGCLTRRAVRVRIAGAGG